MTGVGEFEFATATRIVFGAGAARQLGHAVSQFGRRALLVTGRSSPRTQRALMLLQHDGIEPVVFSVTGEPTLEAVNEGMALARAERCEVVIGFGGGSALDAGKAIAAMLANPGDLLDYLEIIGRGQALRHPSVPFLAVPTTAGTGSEVTRNAVLGCPSHRLKVSLRSPLMLPRVALVDPELTYDLPPDITARTGLDALTQLIEPFVSSRANPLTDGFCREGLVRVAKSLRLVCAAGQHPGPRHDMALASLLGGLALANAGLGAVHGLAGPLGGHFSAPHGALCAILLPHVVAANIQALQLRQPQNPALARYQETAQLLTGAPRAGFGELISWLQDLVRDLHIPPLSSYRITSDDISEIVPQSVRTSSMKGNPITLEAEELAGVLRHAL
jgi:alcohol dehydrogenase class IV